METSFASQARVLSAVDLTPLSMIEEAQFRFRSRRRLGQGWAGAAAAVGLGPGSSDLPK